MGLMMALLFYFLLAQLWAMVYTILERIDPQQEASSQQPLI
jgi:hypothetical protein